MTASRRFAAILAAAHSLDLLDHFGGVSGGFPRRGWSSYRMSGFGSVWVPPGPMGPKRPAGEPPAPGPASASRSRRAFGRGYRAEGRDKGGDRSLACARVREAGQVRLRADLKEILPPLGGPTRGLVRWGLDFSPLCARSDTRSGFPTRASARDVGVEGTSAPLGRITRAGAPRGLCLRSPLMFTTVHLNPPSNWGSLCG